MTDSDSEARGLVLGTAGHIDHGKTALIAALTGVDTDRLPEEKARGITIDLGFAPLDLPGFGRVSVVDVPGHEGLVRTMVSGATGIDMVLLVVAADESVMPQTREHVAICDLLGIERGIVALTKTDIADPDFVELASEEVRELLADTSLADAPIVPVSSQTGDGLDALRKTLQQMAEQTGPRTTREGPPRIAIDRIFAMRGFGTVVTGTLVGAPISVGDAVEILPSGRKSKIRGLQTHGSEAKRVEPGTRCAANLQGLEVADLGRGEVVTKPGALRSTTVLDVHLRWLASAPDASGPTSVEFLAGTAERRARMARIGDDGFMPGEAGYARIHLEGDAVALLPGDRFVLRGFARTEGAGATYGGGSVLDTAPPHRRLSDPDLLRELEVLHAGDRSESIFERVQRTGYAGVDAATLSLETGISPRSLDEELRALHAAGRIAPAGASQWIDARVRERMQVSMLEALEAFHAAEPMRPGMPRATLRARLPKNVTPEASEAALSALEESGTICREGDVVRRSDHQPTLDDGATQAVARILATAEATGLEPPNPREWAEQLGVGLDAFRDLVAHLEREGALVRAPGDLWFSRAAVDELTNRVIEHFAKSESLDTQTYKNLIGTSRRTAMPLMELLDELHITRRQGDVRIRRVGG